MKSVKNKISNNFNVARLFQNWKSPVIGRKELCELSGGMINIQTLRTLDSRGEGIPGKIRFTSRKVIYPVDQVILWLEKRMTEWQNRSEEKGGSNAYN